MNVRDDEQPASGASFEPPSLDETGWTRERLLDALKSEIAHPWVGVVLATIRAREVEPDIVATLERARVEELEPASENLLFRGVHILAAARLTRGYGPFVALLAESQDRVGHLLGDAVTATLPKILVGMFDGDAEPLLSLIADDKVDQFVREAALRAFAFLTFEGRIDRAVAEAFLARFEQQSSAPSGNVAWLGWVTTVALLGLESLSPRVDAAFEDGRIPLEFTDKDEYRELLAAALERPADVARFEDEDVGYIEDIVEALELFPGGGSGEFPAEDLGVFDESDPTEDLKVFDESDPQWAPGVPARNPWRDVGRNDPCPCGSGKKFKKCCLPLKA